MDDVGRTSQQDLVIQRDIFALLVEKRADECSLATLAGTDLHDHGGVRKRDGYGLG
jgi:hypothetical protein